MMQPRCGLPDNLGDDGVAFASTCTWEQTDLFYARDIGTNDVAGNDAIDIKTPRAHRLQRWLGGEVALLRPLVGSTVLAARGAN